MTDQRNGNVIRIVRKKSVVEVMCVPNGAISRPDVIVGVTVLVDNVLWKGTWGTDDMIKGFLVVMEEESSVEIISTLRKIGYDSYIYKHPSIDNL
jgi:hypothetical protein